LLEVRRDAGGL